MLKLYSKVYDCYQGIPYVCAYLEKKYKNILDEYRCGEPGMPEEFIRRLPPYKANLGTETVARIIEMREVEKKSFVIIGNELRITTEKAKHAYDWFYHQQVLALTREMSNKAETEKEKTEIWDHYFRSTTSSKGVMKC